MARTTAHEVPLFPADTPQPPSTRSRGPWFWILTTLGAVVLVFGVGAGAFFAGQATRPSDEEVATRLDRQADAARLSYGNRERSNLDTQRRDLRTQFRSRMKKAVAKAEERGSESGYASGQQQGFSSGQAAGYSNGAAEGRAAGEAEGKEKGKRAGKREGREQGQVEGYLSGFDDGTCYDPETYEYVC